MIPVFGQTRSMYIRYFEGVEPCHLQEELKGFRHSQHF